MAQTVKINGVVYNDVSEVKLPLAADISQLAVFADTSDATAAAADIRFGKTAYAGGMRLTGTRTDPTFTLANGALSIA